LNEKGSSEASGEPAPSAISLAWTVTVHVVPAGSELVGVSVYELAGELLALKATGVPDGHSIENALPVALTLLEKLIVIVELGTASEPSAGLVVVTVGGMSTVNEKTSSACIGKPASVS